MTEDEYQRLSTVERVTRARTMMPPPTKPQQAVGVWNEDDYLKSGPFGSAARMEYARKHAAR